MSGTVEVTVVVTIVGRPCCIVLTPIAVVALSHDTDLDRTRLMSSAKQI